MLRRVRQAGLAPAQRAGRRLADVCCRGRAIIATEPGGSF